jgi:choline monooxygenase
VASCEADGLVVIGGLDAVDANLHGQVDDAMGWLRDGTPWRDKLVPADRVVFVESILRPMNWKVLVEQFLEGYHLRTTHKSTFYPVQYDDLNVVERFGPNSRITFPYRNIERLRDRAESTWTVDARVTYLYQLFPNVMLATFPGLISMVVIDPVDVDHSMVTTYSMVSSEIAEQAARDPLNYLASEGSFIAQGLAEDNEMSEGVQRGLRSGANSFVEFGRHESAIGHFHANLDERLARLSGGERSHPHG